MLDLAPLTRKATYHPFVPFATFGLPFFAPRRWELLVLAVALAVALGVQAFAGAPAAMVLKVLGVMPGVVVGATMATRVGGMHATWGGLLAGVLASGLLPGTNWALDAVTTGALFAALGMGSVAWLRMQEEITYMRRMDILCGLATVALVLMAVGLSAWLGRLTWPNAAAFVCGGLVLSLAPRSWEPPVTRGSSPGPGSLLDRTDL